MKRWIFLLALPYFVYTDTGTYNSFPFDVAFSTGGKNLFASACFTKEICEDMAEALNEAHCQQRKNAFEQSCVERASHFTPL